MEKKSLTQQQPKEEKLPTTVENWKIVPGKLEENVKNTLQRQGWKA